LINIVARPFFGLLSFADQSPFVPKITGFLASEQVWLQ
jgi:hypothetical protein